jgi:hypothetical protein
MMISIGSPADSSLPPPATRVLLLVAGGGKVRKSSTVNKTARLCLLLFWCQASSQLSVLGELVEVAQQLTLSLFQVLGTARLASASIKI